MNRFLALAILFSTSAFAEDLSLTLVHRSGKMETSYSYLFAENSLRISQAKPPEGQAPPPSNVFDFTKKTLSIFHPANQSYKIFPLSLFNGKTWLVAGGIGPQGAIGAPDDSSEPSVSETPPPITIPISPDRSKERSLLPPGAVPELTSVPGEQLTLHGYECSRYTLAAGRDFTFTIWACSSPELPPFYHLTQREPSRFGVQESGNDWSAILREKKLFPLRVVVNINEGGDQSELESWEFTRVEKKPLTPEEKALFSTPSNFLNTTREH